MSEFSVEFIEALEDLKELLKGYTFKVLENDKIYIFNYRGQSSYIIEDFKNKFKVIVCDQKFEVENLDIKASYKNVLFTSEELANFIKKEYQAKFLDISVLLKFKFKLIGINIEPLMQLNEVYDEFEYNQTLNTVAYLEDMNGSLYRLVCYTEEGMCGSGWSTASWGSYNFSKLNISFIDSNDFLFVPKGDYYLTIDKKSFSSDSECSFLLKMGKKTIDFGYYDSYGADSYYPDGRGYLDERFSNPDYFKELSLSFDFDEDEVLEILNLEPLISCDEDLYEDD